MIRLTIICIATCLWTQSFGQVNTITPRVGIEGIPITIDESRIDDVTSEYGSNYRLVEHKLLTEFKYDSLGLTFGIDPMDANKIVRKISVQSPFKAQTKNGIILNQSTMKDVQNLYNETGCFTNYSTAYCPQDGITFYIKRDPSKKGFDTNEVIFKIEINNNNEFGIPSRVNFKYDDQPTAKKLEKLQSILNSKNFDLKEIEQYFEKEQNNKGPFAISSFMGFSRNLEFDIFQSYRDFQLGRDHYELIILTSNDSLVYCKLTTKDNLIIERKEFKIISYNLNKRKAKYTNEIDLNNSLSSPINIYTFGTFCGFVGTPPDKCGEMLRLVNDNNYSELSGWLKSLNPEISAYGYVGLSFLELNGKKIKQEEKALMNHISLLDIQLNTCNGCIVGETDTFKDALLSKKIKNNYKAFKQSGWLN
ncbi:hypothetical protein [Marinigracilibium pacificum]|uniref:Uncharacterized protein n=1 Tax=Marinigracilibium pacificum TaxID=2729599 RepID=A0A848IT52_9BACT|nr:hypothetical protein [Marinigracilibium pacificum]NMM47643.1 hypothetical protein [Marinigracilibium pacificum]